MKKVKIIETNFGKIVEEIPVSKFDCCQTHIFIFKKPVEEVEDFLWNIVQTAPAEEIHSYMIHWDDNTEDILEYFSIK